MEASRAIRYTFNSIIMSLSGKQYITHSELGQNVVVLTNTATGFINIVFTKHGIQIHVCFWREGYSNNFSHYLVQCCGRL